MAACTRGILFLLLTVISLTSVTPSVVPECSSCDAITCPAIPKDCKHDLSLDVCGCCYVCAEDPNMRCLLALDDDGTSWNCQWINSASKLPQSIHKITHKENKIFKYKKAQNHLDKSSPQMLKKKYFLKGNSLRNDIFDKRMPAFNEAAYDPDNIGATLQAKHKLASLDVPRIIIISADDVPDYEMEDNSPKVRYVRENEGFGGMVAGVAKSVISGILSSVGETVANTPFTLNTKSALNVESNGDGQIGKREAVEPTEGSSFGSSFLGKIAKGVLAYVPFNMDGDGYADVEGFGKKRQVQDMSDSILPSEVMFRNYPLFDLSTLQTQSSDLREESSEKALLLSVCNKRRLMKTSFKKSKCYQLIKNLYNLDGMTNDEHYKLKKAYRILENIMVEVNEADNSNILPIQISSGGRKYHDRLAIDDYKTLHPRSQSSRNYADSILLAVQRPLSYRELLSLEGNQYRNEMDRRYNFDRETVNRVGGNTGQVGRGSIGDYDSEELIMELIPSEANSRNLHSGFPFMNEGVDSNAPLVRSTREASSGLLNGLQTTISKTSSLVENLTGKILVMSVTKALSSSGLPYADTISDATKIVMQVANNVAKIWSASKFVKESATWPNFFEGAMDATKSGVMQVTEALPEILAKVNSLSGGKHDVSARSAFADLGSVDIHKIDVVSIVQNLNIASLLKSARELATPLVNKPEILKEVQRLAKEIAASFKSVTCPIARKTVEFGIKFSGLPAAAILGAVLDDALAFVHDISIFVLEHKFIKKDPVVDNLFALIIDVAVPVIQKTLDIINCADAAIKQIFKESEKSAYKPVNLPKNAEEAEKSKAFLATLHKIVVDLAKGVDNLTGADAAKAVSSAVATSGLPYESEGSEIVKLIMNVGNQLVKDFMKTPIITEPPSWEYLRKYVETTSETFALGILQLGSSVLKIVLSSVETLKDPSVNVKISTNCQTNLIPEGLALEVIRQSIDALQGIPVRGFPAILHDFLLPETKEVQKILNSKMLATLPRLIRASKIGFANFIAGIVEFLLEEGKELTNDLLESDFLSKSPSWENLTKLIKDVESLIISVIHSVKEVATHVSDPQALKDAIQKSGGAELNSLVSTSITAVEGALTEAQLTGAKDILTKTYKGLLSLTSKGATAAVSNAVKKSGLPFGDLFAELAQRVMQIVNKVSVVASKSVFFTDKPTFSNARLTAFELVRTGVLSGLDLAEDVIHKVVALIT